MQSPLVSIVTPSLNQGLFIEETIRSVMEQDYPHIEHIIVDGESNDGTLEVLERYRSHLRYSCEPDQCVADACNKGVLASRGEIIGLLNADDVLVDRKSITRVVAAWERYPKADVIYFDTLYINGDSRVEIVVRLPEFTFGGLLRDCYIIQPSTFVRSSVVKQNLLDIQFKCAQDYELWLRLAKLGYTLKHSPEVIAAFRRHPDQQGVRRLNTLHEENRSIRSSYGLPTRWSTKLLRGFDKLSAIPRRFRGAGYALTLPRKRDWVFDAKVDMLRLLWRQLH